MPIKDSNLACAESKLILVSYLHVTLGVDSGSELTQHSDHAAFFEFRARTHHFFRAQTMSKRGGAHNVGTLQDKKDLALTEGAILGILEMECNCEPECMWTLCNKLEDPVETIRTMRQRRFAGPLVR